MDEEKKWHRHRSGSLFVPGFLLIGVGIGILFGHAGAGTLIGLGAGFIIWGIFRIIRCK